MAERFPDDDFGVISVTENSNAKRILFRFAPEELKVTIPVGCSHKELMRIIEKNREKLLEKQMMAAPETKIDAQFKLRTLRFEVNIFCTDRKDFYFTRKEGVLHIACPSTTHFDSPRVREMLIGGIERYLKADAKAYLPIRLAHLAQMHGLKYNEVKINSSRSRWGSCSGRKDINLSFYLMLLPSHLIDYVLLHELTHTLEMNHSPRFWAKLDGFAGVNSHQLRRELRGFRTRI